MKLCLEIPTFPPRAEYIQDLPFASIYAQINDQGKIFMVLAFVGQNPETGAEQLKVDVF